MISLIILVTASNLLVADPRLSKDSKDLAQPYWDCVVSYAGKLESSGGSGDEIATAAKQVCREHRMELQASIDADIVMAPTQDYSRSSEQITSHLEDELRSEVILIILAARARRHDNAPNQ